MIEPRERLIMSGLTQTAELSHLRGAAAQGRGHTGQGSLMAT